MTVKLYSLVFLAPNSLQKILDMTMHLGRLSPPVETRFPYFLFLVLEKMDFESDLISRVSDGGVVWADMEFIE